MSGSFFDTNVILYFALSQGAKASRAEQLVAQGGVISVQVLNECANVLRNKRGHTWPHIREFTFELQVRLAVVPVTSETHQTGLRLAERYALSVYDSFIVAAAMLAGCDTLWSEDMQDGLLVEGRLRLRNPFAA